MTAGDGVFILPINFGSYLPTKLPRSGEIRAAGTTFNKEGEKIDTAYSDTITHWNRLASAATYPNDETVNNGFVTEILPLAEAVVLGMKNIKKATDAFADNMDALQWRHSNLKIEVKEFNALPAYLYSPAQETTALEDGSTLPSTRTRSERNRILGLLQTAEDDYQGFIDSCVSAIEASSPAAAAPTKGTKTVAVITGFKNAYGMVNTSVDRAAGLDVTKGGRLKFSWSMENKALSQFAFDGTPKLKKFLLDGKIGPFSSSYVANHTKQLTTWADGKYLKFTDNLNAWADTVARPGFMAMLPPALRNKLSNAMPGNRGSLGNGKQKLYWESNAHGRSKFTSHLTGQGNPARFDKALKGLDKLDGTLKKISKSPIAKYAGKGLGVLDVGMTYYDSYTSNYNEELRNNPNTDPDTIRKEAAKSTAIEGTAETMGKVAGGVAGRALGAAAGQALIPIPGVGAAVGGFVGGIAGEWVGGKLGKGVGEFINDWRQGGVSKAVGDVADAVGDAGKAVGEGIKDIGKGIGKKLLGWG